VVLSGLFHYPQYVIDVQFNAASSVLINFYAVKKEQSVHIVHSLFVIQKMIHRI